MRNENQKTGDNRLNFAGVLAGALIGGLAGAGAMLLLAPQSGAKTRAQIQEKGLELRDQATGMVESAKAQAWLTERRITRDGRRKVNEFWHHSQALVVEKFEQVTAAAQAWKKANLSF